MQAKNNLKLSYSSLMQNKSLALPAFLSSVLGVIFIFAAMNLLGLDFYGGAEGSLPDFSIVSVQSWIMGGALFLIFILVIVYLYCLSLAVASILVKESRLDWNGSFQLARQIIGQVIWLTSITLLIIAVPAAVAAVIVFLSFWFSKIAGILSLVAAIILLLVYIIFILIRLFFALSILVLENKSATDSLKQSYFMTQGRSMAVAKIFGIVIIVTILVSLPTAIANALVEDYVLSQNPSQIAIYWVVTIVTHIVDAFLGALITLYLFYSYLDFIKGNALKKAVKSKKTAKGIRKR